MWLLVGIFGMLAGGTQAQSYNDVALHKTAVQSLAEVGDTLDFSIRIFNEGGTNLTGLSVLDTLPASTSYIGHTAAAGTSFDPATGIWSIGSALTAATPWLELQVRLLVTGEGLIYNAAEVASLNEMDVDSEPGNHFILEDDQSAAAVSVPVHLCTAAGETLKLTAPTGFSDYKWYMDNGSGPMPVGAGFEYVATQPGTYTFSVYSNNCPLGLSCPVIVKECEVLNPIFDLSLVKSLMPGQPAQVDIGDLVHYQIAVTNQGNTDVYGIEVLDHVPAGLALVAPFNGWTPLANGDAAYTLAGPLAPGETAIVEIVLSVQFGASGQSIANTAEVAMAIDANGESVIDIDSTPANGEGGEDDQDDQTIELVPHDPTGYVYCDKTGELVTGGQISVSGPGQVFIVADGSNGYYEFYTDGTPGVYQLSYAPPAGTVASPDCLSLQGPFDPTGLPGPVVLGTEPVAGLLADFGCGANPFYLSFVLEPGDPFIFNNNIPVRCKESLVSDDSVTLNVNCELSDPLFCFDLPYDQLSGYAFELNGSPYTAEFGPCDYLADRYYTYSSLLGFGNGGPYRLESWGVNGVFHQTDFQTFDELVGLMNLWDDHGQWVHDAQGKSIAGGDTHTFYTKMTIRQLSSGTVAVLELSELFAHNSSYVKVPEGDNLLVITRLSDGMRDTVHLRVACLTPDFVEITQYVGEADTICLSTTELQGGVVAVFNACLEGFDNASELAALPGTNCVEAFGQFVGTTSACYVICDSLGICDTTYILVNVIDGELAAVNDTLCTAKNTAVEGEVLLNDELPEAVVSLNVIDQPLHGSVVVNPNMTITYTPDEGYCNTDGNQPLDQFTYVVCTAAACDTATVFVKVTCDGLVIYNGFSPNGDGVNEFFKIDGLGSYPNHQIMVFNRWGNQVFVTKDYRNDWNGWWYDKQLPSGTYFYLIDLGDGSKVLSGYVVIQH